LPVILKPVHLGSSIGIKVARSEIELEIFLNELSYLDDQILVEKYLENIKEYNCSVRTNKGVVECSPIEKPISSEEILSFKDKYEKEGGKKSGGMASLTREIPAKITENTGKSIQEYSLNIYKSIKASGVVRIDFICDSTGNIFFNEINPIPGSMSFYLWEAGGITFREQITESINECLNFSQEKLRFKNQTDIIEKFTA
jgi:D-alanine-D-alanine ligase